jgi:hypothetical protein
MKAFIAALILSVIAAFGGGVVATQLHGISVANKETPRMSQATFCNNCVDASLWAPVLNRQT